MRNHVLVLTTSAVLLGCGGAASAQAPSAQTPSVQQSPATQPTPGGPMMQQQDQTIRERLREQLQERAQRGGEEDSDQDSYHYRGGMGGGMIGRGMMGRSYGHHDGDRGVMRSGMLGPPPMMMRMIFSLMDADGDGKLSLQEFQAAHERIFKAIDANKDGFVTLEEMQDFIRGTSRPASKQ